MPFRSEKQRRFLWLKHPDVAARWTREYGSRARPQDRRRKLRKKQSS